MTTLEMTSITGRYTLPELNHIVGTMLWPRGIPETVSERDRWELTRLLELADEYVRGVPNAYAVDVLENQILNVVTH